MPDLEKPFKIQQQEQTQWCWAAAAASICVFYEDATAQKQCELANRFLEEMRNGVDCCANGSSNDCNLPFDLSDALRHLGHMQAPPRGALPYDRLSTEITANSPVALRIQLADFSAHFVVATACEETSDGRRWVKVADPATGNVVTMEYDDLVSNFRPGAAWDQSYLTK
ncbi:MAG TPA: papain-like cysteine protease family protein [Verrucomicrobiae bacterium]|nr:papain-like cysteine protease family protein [Verrucomicrobiae bacterium]